MSRVDAEELRGLVADLRAEGSDVADVEVKRAAKTRPTPGLATGRSSGWNLPVGWVISRRPAHPALVSEADFIAVQEISAPRGPAGPATHQYLLAELIRCGTKPNRNAY